MHSARRRVMLQVKALARLTLLARAHNKANPATGVQPQPVDGYIPLVLQGQQQVFGVAQAHYMELEAVQQHLQAALKAVTTPQSAGSRQAAQELRSALLPAIPGRTSGQQAAPRKQHAHATALPQLLDEAGSPVRSSAPPRFVVPLHMQEYTGSALQVGGAVGHSGTSGSLSPGGSQYPRSPVRAGASGGGGEAARTSAPTAPGSPVRKLNTRQLVDQLDSGAAGPPSAFLNQRTSTGATPASLTTAKKSAVGPLGVDVTAGALMTPVVGPRARGAGPATEGNLGTRASANAHATGGVGQQQETGGVPWSALLAMLHTGEDSVNSGSLEASGFAVESAFVERSSAPAAMRKGTRGHEETAAFARCLQNNSNVMMGLFRAA
jgi:hypothetical protein